MVRKPIDDFMIAEYARLVQFSSTTINMREGRMNFFLALISGAIIGLSLLQNLGNSILVLFIYFALIGGVFWIGVVTFRNIVRNNFDIVKYQEDMEKIREYFVKESPKIEKYLSPIIEGNRRYNTKFPRMTALINSMIGGAGCILMITRLYSAHSLETYSAILMFGVLVYLIVYGSQRIYFAKELKKVSTGKEKKNQVQPRRTVAHRGVSR